MSPIALIKVPSYDLPLIQSGLSLAFRALGAEQLFSAQENILIKPNLLSAVTPDRAVTPHPTVFEGLLECLQPYQLLLSFGDSPAVHNPKAAARLSGLGEVADRHRVPLADFTQAVLVEVPDGVRLQQIHLAAAVAAADGLVNLAKLKTHALTSLTGALKNLYGVIVGPKKAQMHVQFPDTFSFTKMLAELNRTIRPRLHVVDAITAMEGNGPMNGQPRHCGWLIVGTDPVAVDTAGALMMGYDPRALSVITAAEAVGLGSADPLAIEAIVIEAATGQVAVPVPLASLARELAVPGFVRPQVASSLMTRLTQMGSPILRRYILKRPVIRDNACTRCGQCVAACPVEPKALRQETARAVPAYTYARCIRCYCCQEICPAGAIEVEQPAWLRAWRPQHR